MVMYESIEDAVARIQFYLKHDELRKQIALNGQRKTLEEHSLQSRPQAIFEVAKI